MLERLDPKEWLSLNAGLQKKKNELRKALRAKGVLQKGATNDFDHYKYFSEAQYKELFTELLSEHGLELKFTELDYQTFTGTEKMANGRMPRLEFSLLDIDTGFYETTVITGEGIDKGDKAGYKAYTGALKYYLANTFMVATGDDAEKDSPSETMNTKQVRMASPKQVAVIKQAFVDSNTLLMKYGVNRAEALTMEQASQLIGQLRGGNSK